MKGMMSMQKEIEKIEKILSDEKCVKKILAANTNEEIKQVFKDNGIILNDSQVENIKKVLANAVTTTIKELDDITENVSGGNIDLNTVKNYSEIGLGMGALVGGGIGLVGGGLYATIDTIIKSDKKDGFIKNVCKVAGKTVFAVLISGITGGAIGGAWGAVGAVIDSN